MAWPGLSLGIQWSVCLAILAWAVWHLYSRLVREFAPTAPVPSCHGCTRCRTESSDAQLGSHGSCHLETGPPAAKLKSR